MSHYMTALAMRQKGLKPAAKIVLYWLADHHNGETGECFPSHKRLAEACEMTDRSVRNQIDALKEMGLIEVIERKRDNGSQTSNAYRLILKDDTGRKNIPTPPENLSTPPVKNFPTHNLGNNNLGNEPTPLPPKGVNGFDDFWAVVPRKVAKGKAEKAWMAAIKKAHPEAIISAMRIYAKDRQSKDAQYTAHPATWLNGERWLDEASPSQQDFHNLVSQALGENHGLQPARQIDNGQPQRLFEALQAPRSSGRTDGFDGTARDGRRNEPAYHVNIRPKRFGGAD